MSKNELSLYLNQKSIVEKFRSRLPETKNAQKYIDGVLFAVATDQTGKLRQCSKESIFMAALKAAELGIDIDSRQHGYLIPYGNQVQLQTGYKFYLNKFMNSRMVKNFCCEVVYKNDVFKVIKGSEHKVIHEPDYSAGFGVDDNIILFYAHIELISGMKYTEVMSRAEVEMIKKKNIKSPAWNDYFGEMGRKTVCKRMAKWVQLDDEDLQRVTEYENTIVYDNDPVEEIKLGDEPGAVVEEKPEQIEPEIIQEHKEEKKATKKEKEEEIEDLF